MHRHGPDRLEGPVTRNRRRWRSLQAEGSTEKPKVASQPAPSQDDPPLRLDLIERVRREIAEGVYETPEKWEKALDRLWEEMHRE